MTTVPAVELPAVRLDIDGAVGVLRLDRPPLNVLDRTTQVAMRRAAEQAATDERVRAVVVYGGPRAFSAGADIKEMAAMTHAEMVAHAAVLQGAFDAVAAIPKPVVAAINGPALGGGCELALTADARVCGSEARLGLPEVLLGVIPGAGGTQRLPRLVGPAKAKELIFTGRQIGADEALEMGLVDQVTPTGEVLETALRWARRFEKGPALALHAAKTAIDQGLATDLAAGLAVERSLFAALFATEDRMTGMRRFAADGPGRATFNGR
ncbi:enoyl-CoA hydratase/isomerase family protein [Streptomyces sp. NBC_01190]|uniref:enoyl-CoA hydratase/isomerase family protein n=1 Tax=Streptomyces sp. NBC_01190 TaxID=2903767 RepID=UPI00386EE92D|nr:enoyl-CoA hydratase/isomerase family protein [Streptomyces sp. NBC_01190]